MNNDTICCNLCLRNLSVFSFQANNTMIVCLGCWSAVSKVLLPSNNGIVFDMDKALVQSLELGSQRI